jgi:hypothetical protein
LATSTVLADGSLVTLIAMLGCPLVRVMAVPDAGLIVTLPISCSVIWAAGDRPIGVFSSSVRESYSRLLSKAAIWVNEIPA